METQEFLELLEDLEENIDDLEESLEPLLSAALSVTTKKLPLLDRAKLYVLTVYSIESLLFSYLRLHGVAAKEHAVFKELTRVKQYFAKITQAENGQNPAKPTLSLNKQATGRFIKQALAGNDRSDTERAEREAREKLLAARKLREIQSNSRPQISPPTSVALPGSTSSEQNEDLEDGEVDEEMVDADADTQATKPLKKTKRKKTSKEKRRMARENGTNISKKPKKMRNQELELVKPG